MLYQVSNRFTPSSEDSGARSSPEYMVGDHVVGVETKRRFQGQDEPHNHGPTVDIGRQIVWLAKSNLGSHVSHGASEASQIIHAVLGFNIVLQFLRKTKIKDFEDSVGIISNVVGFLSIKE